MKILVTGGAGFIGSHIVDQLIDRGAKVVIIDNLSTGKKEQINQKASFYHMDLNDPQLPNLVIQEKPEVIIHQAAQTQVPASIQDPINDANINIVGTIRLLESARQSGVKKIIFASSAAVYGNPSYLPIDEVHPVRPLSGYGVGKYTAEQYIKLYYQLYGLEYTILRYANVYGVRQDANGEGGVISIFLDRLVHDEVITIFGDGEQTRDYIYVEDIARANLAAIDHGSGYVLNIGTGISTSINGLLAQLTQVTGKQIKKEYKEERSGDIRNSAFDNKKAKAILKWEPQTDLLEGLIKTFNAHGRKKIIK